MIGKSDDGISERLVRSLFKWGWYLILGGEKNTGVGGTTRGIDSTVRTEQNTRQTHIKELVKENTSKTHTLWKWMTTSLISVTQSRKMDQSLIKQLRTHNVTFLSQFSSP